MLLIRRMGNLSRVYAVDGSGRLHPRKSSSTSSFLSAFYTFFHSAFLPQGFPASVSDDYVPYQMWDTLQAFCSSLTGALAMKAVLTGFGVGDENKTALAAALTWLIKDGASMVGRIAFAWHLGAALDGDAKQWRLFADVLNDAAMFLELLSQYFPASFFTPTICLAGMAKAVVGVAGGATRAALTQHQAKCHNMADVSAKDGSQETLVNLAALLVNLMLLPYVEGRNELIWTLFTVFAALHIYANYKAVSSVVMDTFNQTRFLIFASSFAPLERASSYAPPEPDLASRFELALSPARANALESVWSVKRSPTGSRWRIRHGVDVLDLLRGNDHVSFEMLASLFHGKNYVVSFSPRTGTIDIALRTRCSIEEELEALFFAVLLSYDFEFYAGLSGFATTHFSAEPDLRRVKGRVSEMFPAFRKAVDDSGWNVLRSQFDSKAFRFDVLDSEGDHLE